MKPVVWKKLFSPKTGSFCLKIKILLKDKLWKTFFQKIEILVKNPNSTGKLSSRALRDHEPDLQFVPHHRIDFNNINKDVLLNHFPKASFVTKTGLTSCLHDLSWVSDRHSEVFYPRYILYSFSTTLKNNFLKINFRKFMKKFRKKFIKKIEANWKIKWSCLGATFLGMPTITKHFVTISVGAP